MLLNLPFDLETVVLPHNLTVIVMNYDKYDCILYSLNRIKIYHKLNLAITHHWYVSYLLCIT